MVAASDALFKETIVPLRLWDVSIGRTAVHVHSQIVLDIVHDCLELIICMNISNSKSIAIVHLKDIINSLIEVLSSQLLHGMHSAIVQSFSNGSEEWDPVDKHNVQTKFPLGSCQEFWRCGDGVLNNGQRFRPGGLTLRVPRSGPKMA